MALEAHYRIFLKNPSSPTWWKGGAKHINHLSESVLGMLPAKIGLRRVLIGNSAFYARNTEAT